MQACIEPMVELAEYEAIKEQRISKPGMIQISGCVAGQKAHFMYALGEGVDCKLLVSSSETKAKNLMEDYRFLDDNVLYYPAKDLLFYHADIRGKMLVNQRMEVVRAILEKREVSIVLCMEAFLDALLPLKEIQRRVLHLATGLVVNLEQLKEQLVRLGYEREEQIEGIGQFAVRGGILDIYPLTEELPFRVEFWGDEVDSIRSFDVESQRSIENVQELSVYPATEYLDEEVEKVSFLDYFDHAHTLLFLDDPIRLVEKAKSVEEEFLKSMQNRMEQGVDDFLREDMLYKMDTIVKKINGYSSMGFYLLEVKEKEFLTKQSYQLLVKSVNSYNRSFENLAKDLKRLKEASYKVVLLSASRSRAKRLAEDLRDYNLNSFYSEQEGAVVKPGEILVSYGHVSKGYEYPLQKFVVISESDIFGVDKKKKKRRTYEGQKIQEFTELKVGDYVVHENHGLGVYQGIEKIEVDKVTKDYMKISYAGSSNLYILATQLDLIQKYASGDAKKPKLNRLGGSEWNKTKSRVKSAVREIAKDLVALYATRQQKEGFVYEQDTVWQREFEEMFPFEETQDQLMAIEATKADMESTKIMDRLICGDVGYGKTEIAIRAAFKAVQENKQVVYLVPTTILAQQHYNTFVQRMKEFPVEIDLMCRFRTAANQKATIQGLKKGLVDIVIGTHRVLSKDMEFKDLGLLIIDEEQRFGVQDKEKIKKLKENVDVLTLTATPIPRTLHMSLIGIRDMSVLEEAPCDRMPIQTYVMEYNDEMVREGIERELQRDGQVYYVYNKVQDIADVAGKIKKLVPYARVAFAHGKMKEHELERIMYEFVEGEIDVLVSTTIIETGLDISNVNTMIIHDADRLGLSQLYQLRGRVGRSNRMAYAFMLYRRDKMLKEVAEKRLAAIREFTDLGSGFKIAMRDLEIRGAGNLLGAEQHGHMEAVGYDLYCKMLNEAVKFLKGEGEEEQYTTTVDLNVDAYIPPSYIPNEYQKLDIYKRIASLKDHEDIEDMTEELIDRFGDIPKKVEQLLEIAHLKAVAHSCYIISLEQKGDELKLVMYEKAKVKAAMIPQLLEEYGGDLNFKVEENPYFIYQKKMRNKREKEEPVLEVVKKLLNNIKRLIE